MGNLPRAAYAKSAYDAQYETSPQLKSRRNTMIALRGAIHVACFHHSCLLNGVWRCRRQDVSVWGHATLLSRARGWWKSAWGKEAYYDIRENSQRKHPCIPIRRCFASKFEVWLLCIYPTKTFWDDMRIGHFLSIVCGNGL